MPVFSTVKLMKYIYVTYTLFTTIRNVKGVKQREINETCIVS